jgi:serine protease Do
MTLRRYTRRHRVLASVALLTLFAAAPAAHGQRFRGPDREMTKGGDSIKSAFKDVVAAANKSTVKVRLAGHDVAYGTVVAADGYVLTKASELTRESELTGDVTVLLRDGTEKAALIVGVAEDHDLAMLKIDATGLTPVRWAAAKQPTTVGEWVVTPGMNDAPAAVGVLSVGRRKIPPRNGLLGVALADGAGGAKVMQVIPDSPAEKAGIHVDDVIASVNAKAVDSRDTLIAAIRGYMPGQQVTLEIKRGDKQIEMKATLVGGLGSAAREEAMNLMGGPLSVRNANFPAVLQHDTVLTPAQCGGPVVGLDGTAIGINIARAGRVETFAIPADVVAALIPDLKSGKLAPRSQEKPTTKPAEKKNEE